jgi:hypothetical protein
LNHLKEKLKITYHDINELNLDESNTRQHDRRNINAIKKSIQEFGIRKPIVVDEDTKTIWAGNGVYIAANELEIKELPVAWIPAGIPKEIKQQFGIFDNRTNELSGFDIEKLDELLSGFTDFDIDNLLWSAEELDELLCKVEQDLSDIDGKEYDETIAEDVQYVICPECGHEFPK